MTCKQNSKYHKQEIFKYFERNVIDDVNISGNTTTSYFKF